MKKVMITMLAVALSAIANAATYNWSVATTTQSFNGYEAPSTGSLWAGAVATGNIQYYLIDAATFTQEALLTAMREGEDWSSAILTSGTTGNDGKIAQQSFTTSSDVAGYQLSAYVVLMHDEFAYIGATQTKTADTEGGTVAFTPAIITSKRLMDTDGTVAYSNPGWYATVPEPTTGLLLLLGVAGLALKRKRA